MDQPTPTADNPYIEKMKAAAYERWQAESAERRQIEDIALGRNSQYRCGDMVKIGDDWVVEVIARGGDITTWTAVVDGQRAHRHWVSQEEAVLHLIARRHGDRDGASVPYAARVLNLPTDDR